MGKVFLNPGGGGVGSDELTATATLVLEGYTYLGADTGDEIGAGGMKNWVGTPQSIDALRFNNNRLEVAVAAGYHGYSWALNAYEFIDPSLASSVRVTPSGGSGDEPININPYYYKSVIVDRTAPYNAGYTTGYNAGVPAGSASHKNSMSVTNLGCREIEAGSAQTFTAYLAVGDIMIATPAVANNTFRVTPSAGLTAITSTYGYSLGSYAYRCSAAGNRSLTITNSGGTRGTGNVIIIK